MKTLTIRQPDDWHIHLRDGNALKETCASISRCFARAIVMPNLKPPIATVAQAEAYQNRIIAALDENTTFKPLMTLYLTEKTSVEDIRQAADHPDIYACKLYPAGATTNSDAGVKDVRNILPVLAEMEAQGLPLLVHGEVTDDAIDIFDREKVFIDQVFMPLTEQFPRLRVVFEHITTKDAVDFVTQSPDNIAATITAHHLLYNRNHMLSGGIRPHHYCLPILKRNIHQKALIAAATSGNQKFFLGSDSAPHTDHNKISDCGCAGVYSAPAAIELYTAVFDEENALDKLENFASIYGPKFYQLELNEKYLVLKKQNWLMPKHFALETDSESKALNKVVPIMAGETIPWTAELVDGTLDQ